MLYEMGADKASPAGYQDGGPFANQGCVPTASIVSFHPRTIIVVGYRARMGAQPAAKELTDSRFGPMASRATRSHDSFCVRFPP